MKKKLIKINPYIFLFAVSLLLLGWLLPIQIISANESLASGDLLNSESMPFYSDPIDETGVSETGKGSWVAAITIDTGTNFDIYAWWNQDIAATYNWDPKYKPLPASEIISVIMDVIAWDIDNTAGTPPPTGWETDLVYLNNQYLGVLKGSSDVWTTTTFSLTRPQIEAVFGSGVYPLALTSYIDVDSQHTQNNWAVTVDKIVITIKYGINPVASNPGQFKSDGITTIPEGGITTEDAVVFKAALSDPDNDLAQLQVEVKPANQPFDGTNFVESPFVSFGSEAIATKIGLENGEYHWRARAADDKGNTSLWQEFGMPGGNVDFKVKLVPLYTQVQSDINPESIMWFDKEYANGLGNTGDSPCGLTIEKCGCAITSAVMVMRYYEIATAIDNQDVNPLTFNNWLTNNNGYISNGNLDWPKVSEYSKDSSGLARLAYDGRRDVGDVLGTTLEDLQSITDSYVDSAKPVIIWNDTFGHYLVANEKLATTYAVRDPAWFNTKTLHSGVTSRALKIRDYNNQFAGVRLYNHLSGPVDGISLSLASPAELLITDPQSRRLGKDPITNNIYNEIPNASYGFDGISNADTEVPLTPHKVKNIWISQPVGGEYKIDVIGMALGSYTLDSLVYDANSQSHSQTFSGNTQGALLSEYGLNFTPEQPENINVQFVSERVDECPTLEGDVGGTGCPAKIDFLSLEKIANSAGVAELALGGEIRYTAPIVEGERGVTEVGARLYNEVLLLNLLGNPKSIPLDQLCAIYDDSTKDDALVSHLVKKTDAEGKFFFGVPSTSINYALIESVKEVIAGQSKRTCVLETILPRHFDSNTNTAFREVNKITVTTRETHIGETLVKKRAGHTSQTISE